MSKIKVTFGVRGSGKTTEIIKQAAELGAVIVSPSVHAAKYAKMAAKKLNIKIEDPISFITFLENGTALGRGTGFLFDGLDESLQKMAGTLPVLGVNFCGQFTDIENPKFLLGKWHE